MDLNLGLVTHAVLAVERLQARNTYAIATSNDRGAEALAGAQADEGGRRIFKTMERYKTQATAILKRFHQSLKVPVERATSSNYVTVKEAEELHRKKDYANAWTLFVQQAELQNPRAQCWVGYYCFHGKTGNRNRALAEEYFAMARDIDMDAQYMYAICLYKKGLMKEAIAEYSVGARAGHLYATYELGRMLISEAVRVPLELKDETKGVRCLQTAAGFGHREAQTILRAKGYTWVSLDNVEE
ncbi:hypothetical protein HDV00_005597 [Rhizophlyctis rosea]|nr:hypothetical protein HDV00_005597 [Rhizophlyctis rosea]